MMRLHQYSLLSLLILLSNCFVIIGQTSSSTLEDSLRKAIVNKDAVLVRELIRKGADLNHLDENGETPLFLACKTPMDDERVLVLLIEGGSKFLFESEVTFNTPFFLLYENQTPQIIRKTFQSLKEDEISEFIESSFFIGRYMYGKKKEIFYKLLPIFIDEIINDGKGFNLLEEAIDRWVGTQVAYNKYTRKYGTSRLKPWNSKEIVERLLSYGIDLNHPSPDKSVFYCARESPVVMQFLLEHGFDYKKKIAYNHKKNYAFLLECYVGAIMGSEQAFVVSLTEIHYDFDTVRVEKNLDVLDLYIKAGIEVPEGYTTAYDYLLEKIVLGGNHDFFYEFLRRGWFERVEDFDKSSLKQLIMSSIEIKGFIKEELERIYDIHFNSE